jgi:hypothetical protein
MCSSGVLCQHCSLHTHTANTTATATATADVINYTTRHTQWLLQAHTLAELLLQHLVLLHNSARSMYALIVTTAARPRTSLPQRLLQKQQVSAS